MTISRNKLGIAVGLGIAGLLSVAALNASATVTVDAGPTSLVPTTWAAPASSGQIGLFQITLSQDAGETLSSVSVIINQANASTTVSGADLASVAVYKDNGNGIFSSASDMLAGTNTSVSVGATTTIATSANNTLTGGKFFVSLATGSSWSDSAPADSITVTLPANAFVTSSSTPSTNQVTTGSIIATSPGDPPPMPPPPGDLPVKHCGDTLRNGRLYQLSGEQTVYLSAACTLRPFRGAAVFHARGHKFQNIIELASLPDGVTISSKPALPAEGTLVKGSDATVWFVTDGERRRGFRTAAAFLRLGFAWGQIRQIGDADLNLLSEDSPIGENDNHPNGALIKCGNSPTVFQLLSGLRRGFRTADSFEGRGHAWDHIVAIDCGAFGYQNGAPIED